MEIKVKYFDDNMDKIDFIGQVSDWIDLRSRQTIEYEEGDFILIPLNVAMELPEGFEAHLAPRSSTFKNWGLIQTNSVGVIDNSYSGDDDEWLLPVLAMRDGKVKKGDRIAQFRVMPTMKQQGHIQIKEVDSLGNENRGGFGSTGEK